MESIKEKAEIEWQPDSGVDPRSIRNTPNRSGEEDFLFPGYNVSGCTSGVRGKKIYNKYFSIMRFDEAGKINYCSEFFDVSGIQVQLQAHT